MPRTFYRLLMQATASLDDFRSYAALGKAPPASRRDDADFLHRWEGLSVYDSYREARRMAQARAFKRWACIAELRIPDDAPIIYGGPDEHGHWNRYNADPSFLKDHCVTRIVHAPDVEELVTAV